MQKFILASANQHKADEFSQLFKGTSLEIVAATESLSVAEIGTSLSENAYLKAKAYFDSFKKPCLSDDSGIFVEALPDELGILSARFGGDGLTDRERSQLLLEKLQGVENREASFRSHLCFILADSEVYFFEGRLKGRIASSVLGEHGFGYDPIFLPEGLNYEQSLAQVPDWKQLHSHRAIAVGLAAQFFKERD